MKLSESAQVLVERNNKKVYLDGDTIVKVFNNEKPAAEVFNEALNLARVEPLPIETPKIVETAKLEEGEHAGSWALVTSYVPGSSMEAALKQDPSKADELLEAFVTFQVELHQLQAPLLNRQKDKLHRMLANCSALDASVRYDLEMRIDGLSKGNRVCHGDFNFSNVIIADDASLALCDWAHVTAGLPAVDAAMTYLLMRIEHPELAESYLEKYAKASDTPKHIIFYWIPVVAAAELSRKRHLDEDVLKQLIQVGDYE